MKEQDIQQILADLAKQTIPTNLNAWPAIQARLQTSPQSRPGEQFWWLSARLNSTKKAITVFVLAIVVLSGTIAALTPAVRAQVMQAVRVTLAGVEDNFLYPAYLPEGFQSSLMSVDGFDPGSREFGQLELKYHYEGQFMIIAEYVVGEEHILPQGRMVTIQGQSGVLVEGLAGTVEAGFTIERDEAGQAREVQVIDEKGNLLPEKVEAFPVKSVPIIIDYNNGRQLTWYTDELKIEILSNLPEAELLKIAESLARQE